MQVTNLAASRAFYVDLLGLDVVDESSAHLCLRGVEEREWSLMLEEREEPAVRQIGFKTAAEQELDALEALAAERGWPSERRAEPGPPRRADPRGVPGGRHEATARTAGRRVPAD